MKDTRWRAVLAMLSVAVAAACSSDPPPATDQDVPVVEDLGEDTGNPPVDTGNPPVDTGIPPVDTGIPPVDSGIPVEDTGIPPVDTGNPVEDTGNPVEDTGNPVDGGNCLAGQIECGGMCVDPQTNSGNCGACGNACGASQSCEMGRCACPSGQSACGASCVDLQTSSDNCGACSNACPSGQMCAAGMCIAMCTSPRTLCGMGPSATCVDTDTDTANCGSCGTACPSGQVCAAGQCGCAMGQLSCNGSCVDGQSNNMNCGACGTVCPTGQTCQTGRCACASGQTACGMACVNTQTDNANCGACDNACPMGQTCQMGACACPTGQTACGNACVNTDTSATNCGACGNACTTGQTCQMGACACPTGQTACGNACVNTNTSATNCGACGRACGTGQTCVAGACTCATGQILCNGACVNPRTDNNNCGMCGTLCLGGQTCTNGACACPTGQVACNGACVNVQTNNNNCGMCGRVCTGGQSCTTGACACPAGQTVCDGVCVNPQNNNNNCGMCGRICTGGASCTSGTCVGGAPPNDRRTGAITISMTAPSSTFTVNTTNAVNDTTPAAGCTNNTCATGRDVFYRFVLTAPEIVYADTVGSAFDTLLYVQDANGNNITNTLSGGATCNDDNGMGCATGLQSMLVTQLNAGTYFLVLGGCSQGAATLRFQHFPVGGTVRRLTLTSGTSVTVAGSLPPTRASAVSGTCCSTGPEDTFWGVTCPSSTSLPLVASTCGNTDTDTTIDQRSATRAPTAQCQTGGCGVQATSTTTLPGGPGLHTLYVDSCSPIGNPGGSYTVRITVGTCPAGQTLCDGRCVVTTTDSTNCGTCGTVCGGGTSCVASVCACPTGTTNCGGTCVPTATDLNNCGACNNRCTFNQTCTAGTCTGSVAGPSFQVAALGTTSCQVLDVNGTQGDHRGGIAVNASFVFTTGDSATARASLTSITSSASVGQRHDAMFSNLRTSQAYVLASSAGELSYLSGAQTVTRLLLLNAVGALTSTAIPLRTPAGAATTISINTSSSTNGIYSGYDRALVYNGSRAYHIELPTGIVTDLGVFTMPSRVACESFANFGVVEYIANQLSIVYVRTTTIVSRTTVPQGTTTTLGTFTNLGDMCSITVSPITNRWYFHHEAASQFRNVLGETLGSCAATLSYPSDAFRITTLSGTSGCRAQEHVAQTGDDRGGIGISSSHVYYTGDGTTGRFSANDLSGAAAVTGGAGARLLTMVSDLATQRLFVLGNGTTQSTGAGVVNGLLEVNASTGALTGRRIAFDRTLTLAGEVGYFSGWNRIVLTISGRVYDIALPTGTVLDRGARAIPAHTICESDGFWGTAEWFGDALYLNYVQSATAIVRLNVATGAVATIGTYTNLSDMCSFTYNTRFNRWYFHHEGVSQFRGSPAGGFADETIGYCAGGFSRAN